MASHRVCSEACLQTLDRWMGTFGGWSQKPQLSLSNVGWAHDLFTPMDANMRIEIKNRARDQDKEMVRKTISKTGGKKHVFLCFGIIIKSFVFGLGICKGINATKELAMWIPFFWVYKDLISIYIYIYICTSM